jgi:phage FluMu protein gp41
MLLDYYYGKATQKTEIVGEIQTTNKPIDLKKLSLEELKELERIAERLDSDKGSDSE